MLKIKKAQYKQDNDFRNVGIRRLMSTLADHQYYASEALSRLNQYLSNQRYDLDLVDIQADDDLRYALENLFGNDWEKIVTGNLI